MVMSTTSTVCAQHFTAKVTSAIAACDCSRCMCTSTPCPPCAAIPRVTGDPRSVRDFDLPLFASNRSTASSVCCKPLSASAADLLFRVLADAGTRCNPRSTRAQALKQYFILTFRPRYHASYGCVYGVISRDHVKNRVNSRHHV
jgi:hypothetical protein